MERRAGGAQGKSSKWAVSLNDFNLLTVIGRGRNIFLAHFERYQFLSIFLLLKACLRESLK